MEQQLKKLQNDFVRVDEKLDNFIVHSKEHSQDFKKYMDDDVQWKMSLIEKLDKKFASKWVESSMKWTAGLIVAGVIFEIMRMTFN